MKRAGEPTWEDFDGGLSDLGERRVARADNGRFYEFDTETGEPVESWGPREFRVGGRIVEFSTAVERVVAVDGVTVIKTAGPEASSTSRGDSCHLWGFDAEGTELWRRLDTVYRWGLKLRDGSCCLFVWDTPVRATHQYLRLDERTGKIVGAFAGPAGTVKQHIDFEMVDEPTVYPSGRNCVVLDADGSQLWRRSFDEAVNEYARGTRDDGRAVTVLRTRGGTLHCVADDGTDCWSRTVDGCWELAAEDDPRLVPADEEGGPSRALDLETGSLATE
ncbi:outer membrane protein assembly factor BamB family protein [Halosimplex sp. J119]